MVRESFDIVCVSQVFHTIYLKDDQDAEWARELSLLGGLFLGFTPFSSETQSRLLNSAVGF